MDVRRRRSLEETAEERLDRLIRMEQRAREPPAQPEVRRLKVADGSMGASAGASRGEAAAPEGQETGVPLLALPPDQEVPAPEGLLAPLFDDVGTAEDRMVPMHRMDAGDSSQSTALGGYDPGLQMEPYHGADQGQGQGHHGGSNGLREAGSVDGRYVERGTNGVPEVPHGVNAFWSPEVRRAAMEEQSMMAMRPQDLPPVAGPPVTFGPVQALGHLQGGGVPCHLGPQQAPLQSSPGAGPVQAMSSSAGPVQAHGVECQQAGPEQALISTTCSGLGPTLGDGVLSQPSPERGLEELRLRIVREAERSFLREARKYAQTT